ncbi:MAG: DUF4389 domain-containing protein [Thermodesulfobacteriota bacterium]
MNKIINWLLSVLKTIMRFFLARKNVALRFIFTLFFIAVLVILVFSILVLTLVQFLSLFLFVKPVDPVKSLSNKLTVYVYKILRYLSLSENKEPFPFSAIPEELETPEAVDLTNPQPEVEDVMSPDENLATAEKGGVKPAEEAKSTSKEEDRDAIILDYQEGENKK